MSTTAAGPDPELLPEEPRPGPTHVLGLAGAGPGAAVVDGLL